MTSLNQYLENDHWRKMYLRSLESPNGGFYGQWQQGSPGMNSPIMLYSNEYSYLQMKHGSNNNIPYRGNLQNFSPKVTPQLRSAVTACTHQTLNPVGCMNAAINQVLAPNQQ